MYKLVKEILDFSKERDVNDVLNACDMYASEHGGHTEELKKAKKVINEAYDFIVKCRKENDEASIEELCTLIEKGDRVGVEDLKRRVAER